MRRLALLSIWVLGGLALGVVMGRSAGPAPRVVAVWPAGPFETRVAFDRPFDAAEVRGLGLAQK